MDNDNKQPVDITKAIVAGLEVFNDPDIKVRADLMEDLVTLKHILNAIGSGNLVVTSPDRILSKDVGKPEPDNIEEK